MCDQEFLQDEDGMGICSSMHHLSTAADHLTSAAPESLDNYTPIYTNSTTKRHSPSSPSQFQEPLPKRAAPNSPFSTLSAAAAADYHLLGYTKLPLPHPFPAASPPPAPLRRTLSEPIYSPGTTKPSAPQSTVTPARPPAARNSSRSPISGGSHRTRRMKERIRELWNQVASEDGDEHENCCCHDYNHKDESGTDVENPSTQEAVWVEKNGESLVLHFKCPCGNGYEVLLSGTSCYYKLTNF